MDWRGIAKRIAILIAGSILILLLFVYIPMVSANVQDETTAHAHLMTATSVQSTPTIDPTLTALQKEQLTQQIDQQQHNFWNWFWNLFTASLSSLVLVLGGLYAFFRWLWDRQDVRKKQAEERFKSVVDGLGGETTDTKLASTVMLRTFLNPDYKEFYVQVFDLAVANLRPQKYTDSSATKSSDLSNAMLQSRLPGFPPTEESTSQSSIDIAESPDPLTQARITAFLKAFPLAREELKKRKLKFDPQFLNATNIQLDNAFLYGADLREAWMPGASLTKANLRYAILNGINLQDAHLIGANLEQALLSKEASFLANLNIADLTKAKLFNATLIGAVLRGATLTEANLIGADLTGADLREWIEDDKKRRPAKLYGAQCIRVILTGAKLIGADLQYADLSEATLTGADLSRANLTGANLTKANLTKANLTKANLSGAIFFSIIYVPRALGGTIVIPNHADLSGADLSGADLSGAKVTDEQLAKAASLEGATMPDGSIHS